MALPFALFGILFLILGILLAAYEVYRRRDTIPVPAKLIGHSVGEGISQRNSRPMYRAMFEFRGSDGQLRLIESSIGSSVPMGKIGDSKMVYIRMLDPSYAHLGSSAIWIWSMAFCGIGAAGLWFFRSTSPTFNKSWIFDAGIGVIVLAMILRKFHMASRMSHVGQQEPKENRLRRKTVFRESEKHLIRWADFSHEVPGSKVADAKPRSRLIGPVLILIAAGLGGFSWWHYQKTERFLAVAQRTEGQIVEMVASRGSKGGTTYAPRVEFHAPSGQKIQFKHPISSNPPSYEVGQTVAVLFDPDQPEEARIDLGFWNQIISYFAAGFSFILFLFGLSAAKNAATVVSPRAAYAPQEDSQRRWKSG